MQMLTNDILISVINLSDSSIVLIPWTPKKIKFRSGSMRWAEYDIMDIGEITEAVGRELRSVAWSDGILPGPGHKDYPWQHAGLMGYQLPEHYQGIFSMWYQWKTPLLLIVTNTPICMRVKIEHYNITYQDAAGDYHYDISFREDRRLNYVYAPRPGQSAETERDTKETETTYTIKEDDTLWGIAECYLGNGMRYKELYEINAAAIEQAAIEHGFPDSDWGNRVFGGTVIKLPDSTSETLAGKRVELPMWAEAFAGPYDAAKIAMINGPFYLYDGQLVNDRYRVCRYQWECGKDDADGAVSYWIDKSYAE